MIDPDSPAGAAKSVPRGPSRRSNDRWNRPVSGEGKSRSQPTLRCLVVSHDAGVRSLLESMNKRVVILSKGRVVSDGCDESSLIRAGRLSRAGVGGTRC